MQFRSFAVIPEQVCVGPKKCQNRLRLCQTAVFHRGKSHPRQSPLLLNHLTYFSTRKHLRDSFLSFTPNIFLKRWQFFKLGCNKPLFIFEIVP
jgi:hypothetical protein